MNCFVSVSSSGGAVKHIPSAILTFQIYVCISNGIASLLFTYRSTFQFATFSNAMLLNEKNNKHFSLHYMKIINFIEVLKKKII